VFSAAVTNTTNDLVNPIDTIACGLAALGTPSVVLGAPNAVRLGSDANQGIMVLHAVATFAGPTTIEARCQGFTLRFNGRSDDNVLTALKVGAVF
jgi:hypothetical protein